MGAHTSRDSTGGSGRRSTGRALLGIVAACAGLALSGCAFAGDRYAALDREPDANDAVPTELPFDAWDTADPSTARFIADHEQTRLWLMRGTADADVCLLMYPDDGEWAIGCGGGQLTTSFRGQSFTVVPDGATIPDTATVISDNVYTGGSGLRR